MGENMSRREFMKAGTAAAAAALAVPACAKPQDKDVIRIGLVGCGGRGTGAADNCLNSAPKVEIVALADIFPDKMQKCKDYLTSVDKDTEKPKVPGVKITDDKCYIGMDAYKRLIDEAGVDLVLFATPPHFRAMHFEYAVQKGKHVFMEKPVATDPVHARKVIEIGEQAKKKNLGVLAGTQYRHHQMFQDTMKEIHGGRIGKVISGRAYYNVSTLWYRQPKPDWSPMEHQLRNWYYYCWLSGDQIVEQHVHTIDVTNWAMGGHPVSAVAVGGRLVRTEEKFGNIYDHFCVDYEYPDGKHVMSMCRQMYNTFHYTGAHFAGSQGEADPYHGKIEGENPWEYSGEMDKKIGPSYVQEHADLINSIRAGKPINEATQVSESTLTAIMGREAAYTGKKVTWDDMMKSDLNLAPPKYDMKMDLPVRPVCLPGKTRR